LYSFLILQKKDVFLIAFLGKKGTPKAFREHSLFGYFWTFALGALCVFWPLQKCIFGRKGPSEKGKCHQKGCGERKIL